MKTVIMEEENLSSYAINDKKLACIYALNTTCGDGG
jgi:hypothetical protein